MSRPRAASAVRLRKRNYEREVSKSGRRRLGWKQQCGVLNRDSEGNAHEIAVRLDALVHLNDFRPHKQLHYESSSDGGTSSELHDSSTRRSHDHAGPVKGISTRRSLDAIERKLRANQEDGKASEGGDEPFPATTDITSRVSWLTERNKIESRCCHRAYLYQAKTVCSHALEGNATSFRSRAIRDDLLKRLEQIKELELPHPVKVYTPLKLLDASPSSRKSLLPLSQGEIPIWTSKTKD